MNNLQKASQRLAGIFVWGWMLAALPLNVFAAGQSGGASAASRESSGESAGGAKQRSGKPGESGKPGGPGAGSAPERPAPVLAGEAVETTVPLQVEAVGNVASYSTVQIKSQATGTLLSVHFREGQEVRKGDLLFTLDSRLYDALLKKEQANLVKHQVESGQAQLDLKRIDDLRKSGTSAQEELDRARSAAASVKAQIEVDRAAIQYAQLMVDYCKIASPVTGRTGPLLADEGSLIKSSDAPLVEILQIEPIYIEFSVPEIHLPLIQRLMRSGKNLETIVTIPTEEDKPLKAMIAYLDSRVNAKAGTILLKAVNENRDHRLWPGQYVNVTLVLERQPKRVLAPSQAIQNGQSGPYVYVISPDNTVEYRLVTPGRIVGDQTLIEKGLRGGERIVTDGHLRLRPGAKVEIKKGLGANAEDSK